MPVSKKRRRNGKLKKRAGYNPVFLNKGKEKEEELKAMYTDKKRLGTIKKLKESFVLQKGNAATAAGKCIERFSEDGKKVRNNLSVVTSITLERTKTKVKGWKKNVKKLYNLGTKLPIKALMHKYDPNLLMEQARIALDNFGNFANDNPLQYSTASNVNVTVQKNNK